MQYLSLSCVSVSLYCITNDKAMTVPTSKAVFMFYTRVPVYCYIPYNYTLKVYFFRSLKEMLIEVSASYVMFFLRNTETRETCHAMNEYIYVSNHEDDMTRSWRRTDK